MCYINSLVSMAIRSFPKKSFFRTYLCTFLYEPCHIRNRCQIESHYLRAQKNYYIFVRPINDILKSKNETRLILRTNWKGRRPHNLTVK